MTPPGGGAVAEGRARSGPVRIWWEATGDEGAPVVLLVAGAGSDALTWDPALVHAVADAGYRVVRFDPRDTGRSTWCTPHGAPYTLDDLADDALAVLDDVGTPDAHVVGRSLGGFVAQVIALTRRERLRSLVLVYTSPGMDDPRLPPHAAAQASAAVAPPGESPAELVAHVVERDRATWGSGHPFDEDGRRRLAEARVARGFNPHAARGHGQAARGAPSRLDALRGLDVPTLVVHGDEDPLVPYPHGVALAEAIPGASLVTMPGVGHALPPTVLPDVVPALVAHLHGAEAARALRRDARCDLCEAARITPWFHEDDVCWIAECEICAVPMVVWRSHGTDPPLPLRRHMLALLGRVAGEQLGAHHVDTDMRNIPDHFHAHARPEGGFFGVRRPSR